VTASPFIRHFAIALNDAMPEAERQRLKLFAPRIVGTNDGLDRDRARLVQRMFADEIVPQLRSDLADLWLPTIIRGEWASYTAERPTSPQELVLAFLSNSNTCRASPGRQTNNMAVIAAKLLTTCAMSAGSNADASFYWSKAIGMLDRLCDVGPPTPRPRMGATQVARADYILDHTGRLEVIALTASKMLQRLRRRLRKGSAILGLNGLPQRRNAAGSAEPTSAVPGESAPNLVGERASS